MAIYRIIQGEDFPIRVYSPNSLIIIKDSENILQFNNVTIDNHGDMWLHILIDQNNFISKGTKQYQLFENNLLKEAGTVVVIPSLLIDANQDLQSNYQTIVDAIEKVLAGTASRAQRTVKVADKEIQYMSTNELLGLLSYFKGKVKEEQSAEQGGTNTATDQMKILYKFTIR